MANLLNADDLTFMRRQIDVAAPAAEEPITFYRYASTDPGDRAAGTPDRPVYDPPSGTALTAVVNPVTVAAADQPGGRVTDGGVVFQIRVSLLADKPAANDRIVWASAWYKPMRITEAHLLGALFWVVRGERL